MRTCGMIHMKITFKISNANGDKWFENILIVLVSNYQLRA